MLSLTLLLLATLAAANEPGPTLSGMVVDAEGKPVPGATVIVAEGPFALHSMSRFVPVAAPRPPAVLAEGRSDKEGKFSVSLPAETPELAGQRTRLTVWAYHPKFALAVRLIDRDWPRAGLPLTLALPAAASVRLKVTDADFQSVANALVAPLRVAGHLAPAVLTSQLAAETDAEGRATLGGMTPEDLDTVRIERQAIGAQWAGLPAQGRDKIVPLRLAPVGRLTGRLTADDPQAIAGRTLQFATWQIPGDEHAGGGLADVVTDEEGQYDVPAMAAGSVTFEVAEQPVDGDAPVYLTARSTGPAVEAGQTATFEIPLQRAVRVVQEVRDEKDDTPVAGVRVFMKWNLTGAASGDTDATGRLRVHVLPGIVAPIPMRIPAPYSYPSRPTPGTEVAESADAVTLKVLQIRRGVFARGRVVDDAGRPVSGAEVTGYCEPQQNRRSQVHGWTTARGEFALDAVAPEAQLWLWARRGEAISIEPVVANAGGEPVTLTVGKKPDVALEGRVVDATGQPIAGAAVRVLASQREFAGRRGNIDLGYALFDGADRLVTDADGRFRTPPSMRPNAAYSLEVDAPGRFSCETEAIEPDRWHTTRFADVVLHRAPGLCVVKGRISDSAGRPVEGVAVWQSGDGPRRTETRTDAEGRFELGGVYEAPAILFARKDGFRLQGARIAPADDNCRITLRRADEPVITMAALPPALPIEEQRELAMSLVEPLLPMLRDPAFTTEHAKLLRVVSRADPARAMEIADKELTNPAFKNIARQAAALSLAPTDFEEGRAVIALIDQPWYRVETCVLASDELIDGPRERRTRLLDEALLHARTETDPGLRARELGRIAVRWLDLGEREPGVALLREGQALAEALPAPDDIEVRQSGNRGPFAGALARIDGPAALRLIEGFRGNQLNHFRADVARGLADNDPAEAERLFRLIESPPVQPRMRLAPLERMAGADAERAARLARTYIEPCERAFALGTAAHGLAAKDRAAAARLLEEAYGLLDRARQLGPPLYAYRDPAVTAAALLPVAEKIDPALVEGYFWRSLSLRAPWPAAGDSERHQDVNLSHLATMISRYDREIARDLLAPLAGRSRRPFICLMALAVIDARWAADLVQAMPDVAAPPSENPKLIGARLLAEWLALPPRGFWGLWEKVYIGCGLRDPDTLDDLW